MAAGTASIDKNVEITSLSPYRYLLCTKQVVRKGTTPVELATNNKETEKSTKATYLQCFDTVGR